MTVTDFLGYAAAFLVLLTFSMKTMVQLRIVGILSNVFFIAYAYLMGAYPILILHAILLPLNIFRLWQIMLLIRKVEDATGNHHEMEWLKPITHRCSFAKGQVLFHKGDPADRMMFVVSGAFLVKEINVSIGPGNVIGELGLLKPEKTRTQTIECTETGDVLEITYDQVKQLYFQSPKFGFYFLQLASRRLFENIERQDKELASLRAAGAQRG
jgi:CRP/FNR family cyclic AMP-dependent transcriptional regulator